MNYPKGSRPKKFPMLKQFWLNVNYFQGQYDITNAQMAKIMGISKATFQNRKNKVQHTTGAEMEKVLEYFRRELKMEIELPQMFLPLEGALVLPYDMEDDAE